MKLEPALIELVVAGMAAMLAFYRRLGIDTPADRDNEPHVDVTWGRVSGMRYAVASGPDGTPVDLFAPLDS